MRYLRDYLLSVENGSGAKFNFNQHKGSSDAQNVAMTGEVSVVVTSSAEQQPLLPGGKLRALGMLIPDAFEGEGLGATPSSFTAYPGVSKYLPNSQAIGFAVPAGTPEKAKAVLVDAFKKAMATDKVKSWAKENYYLLFRQNRGGIKSGFRCT